VAWTWKLSDSSSCDMDGRRLSGHVSVPYRVITQPCEWMKNVSQMCGIGYKYDPVGI